MTKEIPAGLGPARAFKQRKRAELQRARRALVDVRFACVYMPAYVEICKASDFIDAAIEQCSQKNWGR